MSDIVRAVHYSGHGEPDVVHVLWEGKGKAVVEHYITQAVSLVNEQDLYYKGEDNVHAVFDGLLDAKRALFEADSLTKRARAAQDAAKGEILKRLKAGRA